VNDFQQATTALGRIKELTATQSALIDGTQSLALDAAPALDFRGVTFGYSADAPVLHDLSFRLQPGEVLGVVGRTGSGKTTLARLLFRFYDPWQGSIHINDVALRDLQLESLRANIGFVTQDVQLFHATVRENMTLFDSSIPDDAVLHALLEVGLSSWLGGLEQGLDTVLAGSNALSAGEAQLLAFGRVLLKNPAIIVLDEATSRLDGVTERHIEQAVTRLLQGRTAILIAHRLHTLTRAGRVLVLEQGRVVELGTYDALAQDPNSHFAALLRRGALLERDTAAVESTVDSIVVDPTVVDPTVVDPTVVDPTVVDPTVVDPTAEAAR
jgi:ABC-type multidrug transport system fused ATPase/permease subunit